MALHALPLRFHHTLTRSTGVPAQSRDANIKNLKIFTVFAIIAAAGLGLS